MTGTLTSFGLLAYELFHTRRSVSECSLIIECFFLQTKDLY